jgi:hypothetical protein
VIRIAIAKTPRPTAPVAVTISGLPERYFVAIKPSPKALKFPCRTAVTSTAPPGQHEHAREEEREQNSSGDAHRDRGERIDSWVVEAGDDHRDVPCPPDQPVVGSAWV